MTTFTNFIERQIDLSPDTVKNNQIKECLYFYDREDDSALEYYLKLFLSIFDQFLHLFNYSCWDRAVKTIGSEEELILLFNTHCGNPPSLSNIPLKESRNVDVILGNLKVENSFKERLSYVKTVAYLAQEPLSDNFLTTLKENPDNLYFKLLDRDQTAFDDLEKKIDKNMEKLIPSLQEALNGIKNHYTHFFKLMKAPLPAYFGIDESLQIVREAIGSIFMTESKNKRVDDLIEKAANELLKKFGCYYPAYKWSKEIYSKAADFRGENEAELIQELNPSWEALDKDSCDTNLLNQLHEQTIRNILACKLVQKDRKS